MKIIRSLVWGLCLTMAAMAENTNNCGVNGVQLLPNCPQFGVPVGGGSRGRGGDDDGPRNPTPEPATWACTGLGIAIVGVALRNRRA